MKIEVQNNVERINPLLGDLSPGECAWIQGYDEPGALFDVLVMVTDVERTGKSYVCLENGYTRPIGNCFMKHPAIPVKIKVMEDK